MSDTTPPPTSHEPEEGYVPSVPHAGAEHAATKTTATKAHVGAILTTVTGAATAAATMLPQPWGEYVAGAVVIVGVVASWFGIYLTTNKTKS